MTYPPPPPPAEAPSKFDGGLRTNLFQGIRVRLSALETPPKSMNPTDHLVGFLTAFVVAALLGTFLSSALQRSVQPVFGINYLWALLVIVAPITEEISKMLGVLLIAYFMPNLFPNRRYGAAWGAAAGLGFASFESILYLLQQTGLDAFLRLICLPMMHPVWSAFVGLGVFVFAARKARGKKGFFEALSGLPLLFLFIAIFTHIAWNAIVVLLPAAGGVWRTPGLTTFVNILIVFPVSALILRDFLGGLFNFKNFFESIPELPPYYPKVTPPPPPPPSVPTCPICGQPLTFIQQYNRWYCSKCKKYV